MTGLIQEQRRSRVLVVDDEPFIRDALSDYLSRQGFEVVVAASCTEACARAAHHDRPDAFLMDLKLPDGNSIDILPTLRQHSPTAPIVLLSGYGTIDIAVRALKSGADHFFTKPVSMKDVARMLFDILARHAVDPRKSPTGTAQAHGNAFVGDSPAMRSLYEDLDSIARSDCPVLILGETGTGKSLLARRIHAMSLRAEHQFVDVNCGGLSASLAQSELFGHERGAFTGAQTAKVGLFEAAHRGTLFLDEIGDIDPGVQRHVLKALEEKRFRRVGDTRERSVDLRLISATHRDLTSLTAQQSFRQDLYYRISAFCVTVPALRDRLEDLPGLAQHLVTELCNRNGRPAPALTPRALAMLAAHRWPGNIRELRNVLERATWLHRGPEITDRDLRFDQVEQHAPSPRLQSVSLAREETNDSGSRPRTMRQIEREVIVEALRANAGHVGETAVALGIPRSTLYQKLKSLGVSSPRHPNRDDLEPSADPDHSQVVPVLRDDHRSQRS